MFEMPVTWPPGRARLPTNPSRPGRPRWPSPGADRISLRRPQQQAQVPVAVVTERAQRVAEGRVFAVAVVVVRGQHPDRVDGRARRLRLDAGQRLGSRWLMLSGHDPVSPLEHLWRDRDANLLRCLEVNDDLGVHDDLDGQVGWLGPLENPVDIGRHAP